MRRLLDMLGGCLHSIKLFIQCRGRQSKGSYLAWRKETAFGKDGQFATVSKKEQLRAMLSWSVWAYQTQKKHKRRG